MTTVLDNKVSGPALHAFIIAVGYYQHLPGGRGRVLEDDFGLEQLPTPPISAEAMLDWLTHEYRAPNMQLGSVELLVSKDANYRYQGRFVGRATLENTKLAFEGWRKRCDKHDNTALFYFCGHGFERDHQFLLLEDFGSAPSNELSASIDLNRFHDGMARCRADTQVFIADACRQLPWELKTAYGGAGDPLIAPSTDGRNWKRNAPILRATKQGKPAFGEPGQVTDLTQVLLRSLRGAGASEDPESSDQWVISQSGLVRAVKRLLSGDPPGGTPRQTASWGGDFDDMILTHLAGPPEITVLVNCIPQETEAVADLELRSHARGVTRSRHPGIGTWPWREEKVPAARNYWLSAKYVGGCHSEWSRKVAVLPPLPCLPAEATE